MKLILLLLVLFLFGCSSSKWTQGDDPELQYKEVEKRIYMLDGSMFKYKKRIWFMSGGF